MSSNQTDSIATAMRAEAQARGFGPFAKALCTSNNALGSYFAGTAREGTVLVLEARFSALKAAEAKAAP